VPATIAELFPARTRFSALSIGYNGSLAVFGGTAPMVAGILIQETGATESPAFYLMVLAIVSGTVVWRLPETYRHEIE
jgi:MHS family proline/betaine transporter-like MFS transporter